MLALIAAGYFGVTANKAKKDADIQALKADKQKDSTQQALDRITKLMETSIGKKYRGGIIFYSDSMGEHGLIAAEKNLDSKYTWEEAKKKCENYSVAVGDTIYGGWRLPTIKELEFLYTNREKFSSVTGYKYWSSTEYLKDSTYALELNFANGYQFQNLKTNLFDVRPVRDF